MGWKERGMLLYEHHQRHKYKPTFCCGEEAKIVFFSLKRSQNILFMTGAPVTYFLLYWWANESVIHWPVNPSFILQWHKPLHFSDSEWSCTHGVRLMVYMPCIVAHCHRCALMDEWDANCKVLWIKAPYKWSPFSIYHAVHLGHWLISEYLTESVPNSYRIHYLLIKGLTPYFITCKKTSSLKKWDN